MTLSEKQVTPTSDKDDDDALDNEQSRGIRLERELDSRGEGKKRAFIVDISSYKNKRLHPLDFCQKDGEAMYKLLVALGYEF